MSINNNQGVSPFEMQDLVKSRFRRNDLEILKTGQFSDARLKLDGTVWNVHKSIVCPRSGFTKGLFSAFSEAEIDELVIEGLTKEQVNLLLEFIYSGSIETINDLSLKKCVDLCSMGDSCSVDGMVCYAVNALWYKLKRQELDLFLPVPQAWPSRPPLHNTDQSRHAIADSSGHSLFIKNFEMAVIAAYSDHGNACQLALADFVMATGAWLRDDPITHKLNTSYPRFGSHLFTISQYGPQCQFLRSDRKFITAANPPSN